MGSRDMDVCHDLDCFVTRYLRNVREIRVAREGEAGINI